MSQTIVCNGVKFEWRKGHKGYSLIAFCSQTSFIHINLAKCVKRNRRWQTTLIRPAPTDPLGIYSLKNFSHSKQKTTKDLQDAKQFIMDELGLIFTIY